MSVKHIHNISTSNQLAFMFPTPYFYWSIWRMAQRQGFEPWVSVLETDGLAVNQPPHIFGADRRIRTPAGFYTPTCFQDTPLQPLEYIRIWSTWRGTISQQPDWKSRTLPIELHVHIMSAPKFFQSEEIFTWRCITVSWMTSPHTDFPLLKISPYQCPVSRLSPLPRHWLRMPLRYYYCLKVVKQ